MYRIYKNILHSFPGGFKILVKSIYFREFYGPFPGVSRMIREVSHVCIYPCLNKCPLPLFRK